jgi:hypothetical protein
MTTEKRRGEVVSLKEGWEQTMLAAVLRDAAFRIALYRAVIGDEVIEADLRRTIVHNLERGFSQAVAVERLTAMLMASGEPLRHFYCQIGEGGVDREDCGRTPRADDAWLTMKGLWYSGTGCQWFHASDIAFKLVRSLGAEWPAALLTVKQRKSPHQGVYALIIGGFADGAPRDRVVLKFAENGIAVRTVAEIEALKAAL